MAKKAFKADGAAPKNAFAFGGADPVKMAKKKPSGKKPFSNGWGTPKGAFGGKQ